MFGFRKRAQNAVAAALLIHLGGCGEPRPEPTMPAGDQLAPHAAASGVASAQAMPPRPPRARPAGDDEAPRVALGANGAVSSQEAHATDVGIAILKAGGNAVDASVAVHFALAVTHPSAGNLGGGGFVVMRLENGESFALDFRETAPSAATRDMYLDKDKKVTKDSLNGAKAAGIPGSVRGMSLLHKRFGKLSWREVVEPSVKLAKEGFILHAELAQDLERITKKMQEFGFSYAAKMFTRPDGKPFATGDRLIQTDLAGTLEAIRDHGDAAFYEGPLAERMASEVQKAGGIWKTSDLKAYQAKWRDPVRFAYKDHQIITMPPPSAGGVVMRQLLAASETLGLEKRAFRSAEEIHLFAEAMRRAYADRNQLLADPDFVKLPMDTLLDPAYVRERLHNVTDMATPSTEIAAGVPPKKESEQTTHFSVVDAAGNAVANTTTLNTGYGSKYMVPGTGVLLNNEMDDFAVKPGSANVFGLVQGEANKIEAGKRMLSSMTPTIVVKGGELRAVLGSPGGPTITTTVATITRALIDYNLPLDQAVPALRAHHQWLPDQIFMEASADPAVVKDLERRGHKVVLRPRIGHANCIEVDLKSRGFRAVADTSRAAGKAAAY